jgi:hypothetical protein
MYRSNYDLDRVADLDGDFAFGRRKILDRSQAFALITEVDQDAAVRDANDLSFNKLTCMIYRLLRLKLVQDRSKIDICGWLIVDRRGGRLRGRSR